MDFGENSTSCIVLHPCSGSLLGENTEQSRYDHHITCRPKTTDTEAPWQSMIWIHLLRKTRFKTANLSCCLSSFIHVVCKQQYETVAKRMRGRGRETDEIFTQTIKTPRTVQGRRRTKGAGE